METKTLLSKISRSILPLVVCIIALVSGNIQAQNTDTARNTSCGLWARFSYSTDGLNSKFAATSSGYYFTWDFGDNTSAIGENQSHTYANEGSYAVCLTTYNKNKTCSVRVCTKVIVKRPCTITTDFEFSTDGLGFKARAKASEAAQFVWDLGDGTTASGEYVGHYYKQPGSYTVCVKAYSANGKCSTYICKKVEIRKPCTLAADFEFSTDGLGFKARVKASEPAQYKWDFGDGNSASGEAVGHYYKQPGIYVVCVKVYAIDGRCSTSVCKKVEIRKPCTLTADFEFSTDGLGFKARAKASEAAKFVWDLGDGNSASGETVGHYYDKPGTYNVCVKAYSADGRCSTYICKRVEIKKPHCELKVDASYRIDCSTGKVQFLAHSISSSTLIFNWKFSNGTTATGPNPSVEFKPGIYKVCVEVRDVNNRCSGHYCFSITVCKCPSEPCDLRPDFKFRVDCTQKVVYFSAASNGAEGYGWEFGDGTGAEGDFVRHQYKGDGSYEVCLKVWNKEENCVKRICKKVVIDCDTCDLNPKFEYRIDCESRTVKFIGKSNGGEFYYWNFGDGTNGDGFETKHTFKHNGVYLVCLTVKDKAGNCKEQICERIKIECDPCDLNPEFGFRTDCLNKITYFKATSNGGVHYVWSFGDGTSARGQETKHQFSDDGTYEVCLKVYDKEEKCIEYICRKVVIDCNPCDLDPEFKYTVSCPDRIVRLQGASNNAYKYYWSFGDGHNAEGAEMKHQYAEDGIYIVCLTVVDRKGNCKEQTCQRIKIDCDPCDLDPEFGFRLDCSNMTLYLKGSSNGGSLYYWSFGDGSTATGQDTKHTYAKDGIYVVTLTVKDPNQRCKVTISKKIVIDCNECNVKAGFRYEVRYAFDSSSKTRYAIVDFKNVSVNGAYYKWSFGDGGSSDQEHVRHIYRHAGTYKVCLTAIDRDEKCRDMYCAEIRIGANTDIDDTNIRNSMKVYPNPSNGKFLVDCGSTGTIKVQVKDLTGKVVYTSSIEDGSSIDLSHIDNGSYFIEIITESNVVFTDKLLIIK